MKKIYTSLLMILLLAVAGCQSTSQVTGDGSADTSTESNVPTEVLPGGTVQDSGVYETSPTDYGNNSGSIYTPPTAEELRRITTVYFDFDSSEIRAEDRDVVAAHASYMAENPGLRVRLEGHADERGSREYNIGLGERRAQTVRRAMSLAGVSGSQIATLSYGEEKPQNMGHNESSWSENRRVQIVYTN